MVYCDFAGHMRSSQRATTVALEAASANAVPKASSGTTISIMLPCGETMTDATSETSARVGESPRPSEGFTVLVVEDEDRLRQAVVKALRGEGFEVREASNGSAAIDLLRANGRKIDLILLDMTIPGASSEEVAAEATKIRPDIKVILTSAYSRKILKDRMTALQIHEFIRKPFRLLDLVEMVHDALQSRR